MQETKVKLSCPVCGCDGFSLDRKGTYHHPSKFTFCLCATCGALLKTLTIENNTLLLQADSDELLYMMRRNPLAFLSIMMESAALKKRYANRN
jgi:hypothetical protein